MPLPDSSLAQAIETLYDLNVGVIGQAADRHERPHKPLLLLAVLDLIADGQATPDHIPWSQALRERFARYFEPVHRRNDQCTPENPFLYLRQEGWWQPFRLTPQGEHPLDGTPTVRDTASGSVCARITAPMAKWMILPAVRLRLREALIAHYFPNARPLLARLFQAATVLQEQPFFDLLPQGDFDSRPGRSSAFRRKILEIYDCRCAACGLRIKVPQLNDLTFVDAAHLIPVEVQANDHPTNGIALCKNHHWAMDRFLIAPSPEGVWQVSSILDSRRGDGEKDLLDLQGVRLLRPSDEAFYPAAEVLRWRMERLVA